MSMVFAIDEFMAQSTTRRWELGGVGKSPGCVSKGVSCLSSLYDFLCFLDATDKELCSASYCQDGDRSSHDLKLALTSSFLHFPVDCCPLQKEASLTKVENSTSLLV